MTAPTFPLKRAEGGGAVKKKWSPPAKWQKTTGTVADPEAVVKDGGAVAMVCGHEFDVIDIDPRNGGGLAELRDMGMIPPVRRMVKTPSGGFHLYIESLGLPKGKPLDGIDYQGARSFVLAPPTPGYTDVPEDEWPEATPGAEEALRAALDPRKPEPEGARGVEWVDDLDTYLARALDDEVLRLDFAPVGERNDQLNKSAFALGQLIEAGLDEDEVRAVLTEAAKDAGLDAGEIAPTLNSGLSSGKADPRDVREREQTTDDDAALERDAAIALHKLRVQDVAKKRFNAEQAAEVPMPRLVGLDAFLDEPDESTTYRIEGLWPTGGRVMLAAGQKAGKTTLVGNVLRSLADGAPFLGSYETEAAPRTVLIDNEMAEGQIRRWLRDQDIERAGAVDVVPLRGRLSSFNIIDAASRRRWAELLGAADVLIFDCLRPVLDALGLDENHDAGRFLEALDELACEAGIGELLVVHHMGHGSERARGDSRIQDWPDANWRLVPTKGEDGQPDEHGPRYFWARGRDVEQPEAQLGFDFATRHLTIAGGSRWQEAQDAASLAVLEAVAAADEPPSKGVLEASASALGGVTRGAARKAIDNLVRDGQLILGRRTGKGGGFEYSLPGGEITDKGEE